LFAFCIAPEFWLRLSTAWIYALVGVMILFILYMLAHYIADRFDALEYVDPEPASEEREIPHLDFIVPRVMASDPTAHFLFQLRNFQMVHFSHAQLPPIARRILSGEPFTYGHFTPARRGLSDGRMKSLQRLMIRMEFAEWINPDEQKTGMRLTAAGEMFLRELLDHTPLPPR